MPPNSLHVAEKPSVAKEVAAILSHGNCRKRNGISLYNHIYEFDGEIGGERSNIRMTSVSGHLMELDFVEPYKNPLDLFSIAVEKVVGEKNEKLKRQLETECKDCNCLVLWLDCDPEGENIAFEVMKVCLAVNPRMTVKRAIFSALIPRDIFKAVRTLVEPDEHKNDSVEARQEIDLRLGSAFTRFQTKLLRGHFALPSSSSERSQVVSYGPCQFPTLGFIVDRYLTINRFVPHAFWSIKLSFDSSLDFSWGQGRLYDKLSCIIILEKCLEAVTVDITSTSSKPVDRKRPCPLSTIEMQKRCCKYLHLPSDVTMKVAEEMYQRGIISYPRTETEVFREGMDLMTIINDLTAIYPYANQLTADAGVDDKGNMFRWPSAGSGDDESHPPIHPTRSCDDFKSDDERKVYDLICRHFLACCSSDAHGTQTTVLASMGGEPFSCSGLIVTHRNWLEIYHPHEVWYGKSNLPDFTLIQSFVPSSCVMQESSTSPPSLLSEEDLIGQMEVNKIGTDATISEHVSKVITRNYAEKVSGGRLFSPTMLGLALVEAYEIMGYQLNKPMLRRKMEDECRKIMLGRARRVDVVNLVLQEMKECFIEVISNSQLLIDSVKRRFHHLGLSSSSSGVLLSRCGVCSNQMMMMTMTGSEVTSTLLVCQTCASSYPLPSSSSSYEVTGITCPVCQFEVLLSSSSYICPSCYSYPKMIPDIEDASSPPFLMSSLSSASHGQGPKCNECLVKSCPLSAIAHMVGPCPACRDGNISIIKKQASIMISCSSCATRAYFPKSIIDVAASAFDCLACTTIMTRTVKKVSLKFKPGSVPPGMNTNMTICLSCDFDVFEDVGVNSRLIDYRNVK